MPLLADQRRIVAYLDGLQTKVDELRRLQAATQKELDALMPSILAKALRERCRVEGRLDRETRERAR